MRQRGKSPRQRRLRRVGLNFSVIDQRRVTGPETIGHKAEDIPSRASGCRRGDYEPREDEGET